ncbi:flagellar assembly protein FliW [Clostridium sp. CTA-7]
MELISPIHGKMIYKDDEIINFVKGIPGFDNFKKYIIKEVESNSPFYILQSVEDNDIGFIIISPFFIHNDYEVKLSEEIIKKLNIESPEDVLLYSIVTLNSKVEDITANLKAPLVINIKNKKGEQYIIDKEKYSIKEKIY